MSPNSGANEAELFIRMTKERARLLASGDAVGANKIYDEIDRLFSSVIAAGRAVLVYNLLIEENIAEVTFMISTRMLMHGYDIAEKKIQDLANTDSGMTGFYAQVFLKEWKDGKISKIIPSNKNNILL